MTRMHACLVLLAAAALLLVSCSSNSDDVLQGNRGNVRFSLSADAPAIQSAGSSVAGATGGVGDVPAATLDDDDGDDDDNDEAERRIQEAHVTFASLLARNLDGELVDVSIDLPATVDVFEVGMDRTVSLPMGSLPAGTYDQLVVVITSVELVTWDGTRFTIEPPGGGWTVIVRVCPFEVVAGETIDVRLRMFRHHSFAHDDTGFHFDPQFGCD